MGGTISAEGGQHLLADYVRGGQFPLADCVRGDKICGGTESAPTPVYTHPADLSPTTQMNMRKNFSLLNFHPYSFELQAAGSQPVYVGLKGEERDFEEQIPEVITI